MKHKETAMPAPKALVTGLNKVLADSFVLYFKTHSFHWNVTGPNFKSLHAFFEEMYTEQWNAIDEIAERLRSLGEWAPETLKTILSTASVKETGQMPDADGMVEILAEDNRALVETMKAALKKASDAGDEVTAGLLVERIAIHEKNAWMLDSSRE